MRERAEAALLGTRCAQWKPEQPRLRRCFRRHGQKVVGPAQDRAAAYLRGRKCS
jgi:hypothetical protein